jgi:cytidine deaminase
MPVFQFTYQHHNSDEALDSNSLGLLRAARETASNAYALYSKFKVGAAVLLGDGLIVCGVNIENASYPVGICAERSAMAAAISGYPNEKIHAIAISYISPVNNSSEPVFPCGMCRQFLSECEDRNQAPVQLILSGLTGSVIVLSSVKDILPFSFGSADLSSKK